MFLDLFLVRIFFNFLCVPCGGLSWLHVSFLLHDKCTISYRIVSYYLQPVSVPPNLEHGLRALTFGILVHFASG